MANKDIKGYSSVVKDMVLTCTKCKKERVIKTNKPELYTEEVKKKWVCIACR